MRLQRIAIAAAAAAALVVTLAACTAAEGGDDAAETPGADQEQLTVGYACLSPLHVGFGDVMVNGAEDAAKANNVKLIMNNLDLTPFDAPALSQKIEAIINQKPQALVVCNLFGDATTPIIAEATAQGIPVFMTNSSVGADQIEPIATFGQADYPSGIAAGEAMAAAGGTNGLCVNDNPTIPAVNDRCAGFVDAMVEAGAKATVLNIPNAAGDAVTIANATRGALAADPSIDALMAQGPVQGPAVYDVVEESGKQDQILVGSMDTGEQTLTYIQDGKMQFAVSQQPYLQGYYPVLAAAQYLRYGALPTDQVMTGPLVVTAENAGTLLDAAKIGRG